MTTAMCPTAPRSALRARQPQLPPETIAVCRTDRELQFGLSDDVAVTVPLPADLSADAMLGVLAHLDGLTTPVEALEKSGIARDGAAAAAELLDSLVDAGVLRDGGDGNAAAAAAFHVHVLGRGDLARRIAAPLAHHGVRTSSSGRPGLDLDRHRPPWTRPESADLVVLADDIVPDPLVLAALRETGTPHLYVACRDGRVVVGPTVLPGRTPCLRCADLYRAERNPHWPRMSAQLLWTTGWASLPSRVAAVALVLSEVAALRRARAEVRGAAHEVSANDLLTAGHSVELSVSEGLWRRRRWAAHPECSCGAASATSGIVVA